MKITALLVIAGVLFQVQGGVEPARYPVPPGHEHSLFYIQRSKNVNAIVYEANVLPDGSLNEKDPVKIFWIRYTSDSSMAPLTYIQEKFAYGLKATPYPGKPGQYILRFHAYLKKQIYLLRKPDGRHYGAYMLIQGHYVEIKKIFIQINGGTFWFPNIEWVEITGQDMVTHKSVVDRFKPER